MATIILKHSTVKDKLPSSAQFGEVFVNYHNENPFLATLNNQGQFEKFLSENKTKELFYTKSQVNDIIANLESGGTIEFDDYYKKIEVDTLLQGKSDTGHIHDYSQILNTPDLSNFATLSDIPSINGLASEVWVGENYQPKGNYLTEHQSLENYYTKSEADNKFLTSHQDLSGYALKAEIPDVSNFVTSAFTDATYAKKGDVPTDVYTKSETDTLLAGKASSSHTHTASEIVDLDVPKIWKGTLAEYTNLTEIDNDTLYVITDESEQFVTSGEVESMISGYTTLSEVEVLLGGYSTTAHTHDYSEILNTPDLSGFASLSDIPDVSNFITSGFCEDHYQPKGTYVVPSDLDDYALKTDLPTVPDAYTKAETDTLLAEKANSAHTHSYTALTDLPDLSIYLTEHQDISGLATKAELENYMPNSGMTDYALKSEIPSIEGLATEAELANYQSVSGMSEYSTTAHTHSYNDLTDKPTIPSTSGLASETWVTSNFAGTGHTHSQYLTQTSADSRYARVVSCTQAEYDALVQNDQVEQGVLYCISEGSQSSSGDSGGSGTIPGTSPDPIIPDNPTDPIDF